MRLFVLSIVYLSILTPISCMASDQSTVASQKMRVPVDVQPAERIILIAPTDARIEKVPNMGEIYGPGPSTPTTDSTTSEKTSTRYVHPSVEYDQYKSGKDIAILDYGAEFWANIVSEEDRADIAEKYLIAYGQRGLEPIATNILLAGSTDQNASARLKYALTVVVGSQDFLYALAKVRDLQSAKLSCPTTLSADDCVGWRDKLDQIKKQLAAFSPPGAAEEHPTASDTVALINAAARYNERESLGLNSADDYVRFGPASSDLMEPNYIGALNYGSDQKHIEFSVSRMTHSSDIDKFCQYWTTVQDETVRSVDDEAFVRRLAAASGISPGDVWSEIADECHDINSEMIYWRTEMLAVRHYVILHRDPASFSAPDLLASVLKAVPSADKAEISQLADEYSGAIGLAQMNEGVDAGGKPILVDGAPIFWMGSQLRATHTFSHRKLLNLFEEPAVFTEDQSNRGTFLLLDRGLGQNAIELPADIHIDADVVSVPNGATSDEKYAAGFPDPFAELIQQTMTTLNPVVTQVISGAKAVTELYAAGSEVEYSRSELGVRMHSAAVAVREYARQQLASYEAQSKALQFGHLSAGEPVIIDAVRGRQGDGITAGSVIASMSPVFRHRLVAHVPNSEPSFGALSAGTPITLVLECDGPLGTTDEQKRAILADNDRSLEITVLKAAKRDFLASAVITGVVSAVVSVPQDKSIEDVYVSVSVGGPTSSVKVPSASIPGGSTSAAAGALSRVGIAAVVDKDDGSFVDVAPDAGVLSVGDRCTASIAISGSGGLDPTSEAAWNAAVGRN